MEDTYNQKDIEPKKPWVDNNWDAISFAHEKALEMKGKMSKKAQELRRQYEEEKRRQEEEKQKQIEMQRIEEEKKEQRKAEKKARKAQKNKEKAAPVKEEKLMPTYTAKELRRAEEIRREEQREHDLKQKKIREEEERKLAAAKMSKVKEVAKTEYHENEFSLAFFILSSLIACAILYLILRNFTEYRVVLDLTKEKFDHFVKLVQELKNVYGITAVTYSEMNHKPHIDKRAYLQINFGSFLKLMKFYSSVWFSRVMELYRSFTPIIKNVSMRIAKRIARSGVCSRREAERLIENGHVSLNGVLINTPAINVTPSDRICVDGQLIPKMQRTRVVIANKLPGELITKNDEKGRRTIFDRLQRTGLDCHIMPVGQLDYNTEGLLLLTNDGDYSRYLEHPANAIPRRYRAQVYGVWDERRIAALRHSNIIEGLRYKGCYIKKDQDMSSFSSKLHWCTVQVTEGKYHEVKKLMGFVGLQVEKLIRTDFGAYTLGNLSPGEFREIHAISIDKIKNIKPFDFS